jgi:hypothetical protein
MICPKCNFSQPDDYYCAQCGVNVEKYDQKRRKKRFNRRLIITVLSIAALSLALFMNIQEDSEKSDASKDTSTETKVTQRSPSPDKPPEQTVASRAPRSNELARRRSGNQPARKQEITERAPLEDAAKRAAPQSEPKEATLTSKDWTRSLLLPTIVSGPFTFARPSMIWPQKTSPLFCSMPQRQKSKHIISNYISPPKTWKLSVRQQKNPAPKKWNQKSLPSLQRWKVRKHLRR